MRCCAAKAELRGDIDYIMQRVPAALREQTQQRIDHIRGTIAEILENTEAAFRIAPMESRKSLALYYMSRGLYLSRYCNQHMPMPDYPVCPALHACGQEYVQHDRAGN
jgi:hypothetical protein